MALVCLQMQMFLMANRTQTLTRWDELVGFLPLPAGLLDSLFHEVVHLRCAWKQSASWYAQLPAMRMHHHAFCVGLPVSSGNCSHSKGPCLGMDSGSRATCLCLNAQQRWLAECTLVCFSCLLCKQSTMKIFFAPSVLVGINVLHTACSYSQHQGP